MLMLSMHSDDNYIRNAADAGAKGYLLKNAIDVELPDAIRDVPQAGLSGFLKRDLRPTAHSTN